MSDGKDVLNVFCAARSTVLVCVSEKITDPIETCGAKLISCSRVRRYVSLWMAVFGTGVISTSQFPKRTLRGGRKRFKRLSNATTGKQFYWTHGGGKSLECGNTTFPKTRYIW